MQFNRSALYCDSRPATVCRVVETTRHHDLEEFTIELGVARWNDFNFVPERTFEDVIRDVTAVHGLEEWKPEDS
jgi:hypothetical protein